MRTIPEKARELLLHPAAFLSKNTDSYAEIAKYLLALTLVPAAISAFAYSQYPDGEITDAYREIGIALTPTLLFFLTFVDSMLTFLAASGIVHAFAYLWGGRYGYRPTARAVAFSYTPILLLGWIPIVSFAAFGWAIALLAIGLKEQQKMPLKHAVGALASPIALLIVLAEISALSA